MGNDYLLVKADALPEVFLRVVEAKRMLKEGVVSSASEAAAMAGVSRSAYYKYKDSVMEYKNSPDSSILTVHAVLTDRPGSLASFIGTFFDCGANILTVNQNIPSGSVAPVSVSAYTDAMKIPLAEFITCLRSLECVRSIERITDNN